MKKQIKNNCNLRAKNHAKLKYNSKIRIIKVQIVEIKQIIFISNLCSFHFHQTHLKLIIVIIKRHLSILIKNKQSIKI